MNPKKYLLLCLIVISIVGLSVTGLYSRTSLYTDYFKNYIQLPASAIVLKGAASGIYPWSQPVVKAPANIPVTAHINHKKEKSFIQVDDSYFDDAIFIGDSRMVGLSQYCEAIDSRATFYAKKSLTIFDIRDESWIEIDGSKTRKQSLWEAIADKQFSKVYIMVGLNEIGTGDPNIYQAAYQEVLSRIHQIQPNAVIFITSIMHVTAEKSEEDELYNNPNIDIRNNALKALADGSTYFYLDINTVVDDETGGLNAEWTTDDVHLKGSCYEPWHQFLLQKGIKVGK